MRRLAIPLLVSLLALAIGVGATRLTGTFSTTNARAGQLGIDDEMNDIQQRLLSGYASYTLGNNAENGPHDQQSARTYFPRGSDACPNNQSSNIKVNQNCLNLSDPDLQGRGQAQNEESIRVNPNNTNQMIGSYNDYRRGDGTCAVSYSSDGGRTWNDATVPNNFTRGGAAYNNTPREYWQAGGDTSVAWDSKGNAYLSCQLFKRGPGTTTDPDRASGFFLFRSTLNGGASFNFPGRSIFETGFQRSFLPLEDKQLMTVDNNATSCAAGTATATPGATCTPFQDRVYVTWTEFAPSGTAFIYEAYSADYGEHFSDRHLVSLTSPLCPNDYGIGSADTCNENQFSQPFVGADGVLYVVYNNFNNAATLNPAQDNRNQILLSRSIDGGNTFRRRSRSPTTTTCPTARPISRATTSAAHACRRRDRRRRRSSGRRTTPPARSIRPTRARWWSRSAPTSTCTRTRPTAASRPASTRRRARISTQA
jgi:hypothetical protein